MDGFNPMDRAPGDDFFGLNLQILRTATGMSRSQLLEAMHRYLGVEMHATSLRRIEIGEQQAKATEAVAIAHFFGKTVEEMVGRPLDPEAAKRLKLRDALASDYHEVYTVARKFRETYGEARRLLKDMSEVDIAKDSLLKEIKAALENHKAHDEMCRRLIGMWDPFTRRG